MNNRAPTITARCQIAANLQVKLKLKISHSGKSTALISHLRGTRGPRSRLRKCPIEVPSLHRGIPALAAGAEPLAPPACRLTRFQPKARVWKNRVPSAWRAKRRLTKSRPQVLQIQNLRVQKSTINLESMHKVVIHSKTILLICRKKKEGRSSSCPRKPRVSRYPRRVAPPRKQNVHTIERQSLQGPPKSAQSGPKCKIISKPRSFKFWISPIQTRLLNRSLPSRVLLRRQRSADHWANSAASTSLSGRRSPTMTRTSMLKRRSTRKVHW